MKKVNLNVQGVEVQAKANQPVYVPFANSEITTGIVFEKATGFNVKVVEDFEEIASSENEVEGVDFGNIKTACLVVTTTKDTELTILTLNKQ